ncbi:TIGR03915 family putative DNA repair protein [Proteiniborus sp. MB09-C3]|uniref:TIGR03915 family putative DNA repair protein n=1 Tax=Proteiniborus sp. MB09-C3 TaxID=3050072 RepID=UPI00255465AB|nr:TIGR03915 family putative DNA repair protein [Proteiniborus sp. MB09-C3]WIV12330.1 TIGR03915 family putative DNA repair protein [Proteiniborus sp. MB09-C3]
MLYYIYDGSFDGLLTAIYEAYYRREIPDEILSEDSPQQSLLVEKVHIETDLEKSKKVYSSIKTKISEYTLKNCFYVFLSERPDRGTAIYRYLRLGWKVGRGIDQNLKNDSVLTVHKIRQQVSKEVHLMLGFIRFSHLSNGVYYSQIEPDNDIVGLMAPHFAERLSDECWIIHDVRRNIGVMYNKKEWIMRDLNISGEISFQEEEEDYQKLWKEYFNTIAIRNKINPKLQRQHMPKRYWKHLIEKQTEI